MYRIFLSFHSYSKSCQQK